MFGLHRELEDDPFFTDPFRAHQENMRRMLGSFSDIFSHDPMLQLGAAGRDMRHPGVAETQLALRDNARGQAPGLSLSPYGAFGMGGGMLSPFGMMGGMFSGMQGMMQNLHGNYDALPQMSHNPNVHTFSSSHVFSYSNTGSGNPHVYEASSQTRSAPGGVGQDFVGCIRAVVCCVAKYVLKILPESPAFQYCLSLPHALISPPTPHVQVRETRRQCRDSETGIEQMAIGHHIHDRAHVLERSRNRRTGSAEQHSELVNLDEDEAVAFDDEWRKCTGQRTSPGNRIRHRGNRDPQLAITDGTALNRYDW
uniref:Myeloid leukemia factor 2 n=2 Tax=Eptatretus burgeri TaxID=7764 RepID=A0A8C4Q7N2_EPTBU